jgi:hypothetical protein
MIWALSRTQRARLTLRPLPIRAHRTAALGSMRIWYSQPWRVCCRMGKCSIWTRLADLPAATIDLPAATTQLMPLRMPLLEGHPGNHANNGPGTVQWAMLGRPHPSSADCSFGSTPTCTMRTRLPSTTWNCRYDSCFSLPSPPSSIQNSSY